MALIHGPARDLIGQPIGHRLAPEPALTIVPTGELAMAKAPHDGTYTNEKGDRFIIRAGDVLPAGVTMDADPNAQPEADAVEERAKPKAPENKAKAAPENRAEK